MARVIKPVGNAIDSWTGWLKPTEVRRECIPPHLGVYQLAAFTAGNIYTIPCTDSHYYRGATNEKSGIFKEIVYIGKAVCLQERFWVLVQSWQSDKSPARHGSRKSYNDNHKSAKTHFEIADVKVRYKAIGSVDWIKYRETIKKAQAPGVSCLEALTALWLDRGGRGNSRSNPNEYSTVNATFLAERSLQQKFRKAFGRLPLLNIRGPESMGPRADNNFIHWVAAEEAAMESIPCDEGIHFRAFEKWRDRGSPNGDDWKDWFDAELELWERIILY